MAERVGLVAILDMSQFNRGFNQYINSLNKMNSQTTRTATGLSGSFNNLGNSVLRVGNLLAKSVVVGAVAAGGALTAFAVAGINDAKNMEQAIADIASILGITTEEAGILKDVIIELGLDPALKVTSDEAAEAIELLARNGIFAGQTIEQMGETASKAGRSVVLLANATGADFGTAADIATDAMAVFNLELDEMDGAVDSIVSVTTTSKFTIQDFALALRNGGAAAADMGISLEEFNAAIAASAEELGSGMRAGTGFRNFITRLTPNTNKATDAMRELGLITEDGSNIFFDASGELKSMSEITQILNSVLLQERDIISEVGGRTAEQSAALAELRSQYATAEQNILDYQMGVKGLTLTEGERNAKIEEQRELMSLLSPRIEELTSIRGELVTETSKLTDEERSMALETIFGADALGSVLALAKEGAPAFESAADAAETLGISMEEATEIFESGATEFDILMGTMGRVDAAAAAETRMDTLAGTLEILGGIVESVRIQVGDLFIPLLRDLAGQLLDIAERVGPSVVSFFDRVANVLSVLVSGAMEGQAPLDILRDVLSELQLSPETIAGILAFTDGVVSMIGAIGEFVSDNAPAFIGALQGITVMLGSAGVSAVITKVVSLFQAMIAGGAPLVLIAGALGAAWNANFLGIREVVLDALDSVMEFFAGIESFEQLLVRIGNAVGINLIIPFLSMKDTFFNVRDTIVETLEPISGLVQDITSGIVSAFEGGGVGGAIQQFIDDWPRIKIAVGTALFGLADLVGESLGVNLTGIFQETQNTIETITGEIGTALAPLIPIAEGIVSDIGAAFRRGGLRGAIDEAGDIISGGLESALEDVIEFADSQGVDLVGIFESMQEGIGTAWETIQTVVTTAINLIWPAIQVFIEEFIAGLDQFQPVLDQLSVLWEQLQVAIEPVATVLGGILLVAIGLLVGAFTGLATAIQPLLGTLASLLEGVIFAVTGIVQGVQGIAEIIIGVFTLDSEMILQGWENLQEGIGRIVVGIVTSVGSAIEGLVFTVTSFIAGLVWGVIQFFQNLYDRLVGGSIIPELVTAVVEWIISLRDQFLQFVGELVNQAIAWFINLALLVGETIAGWVLNLIAKAIELKDSFLSYITELWETGVTTFTEKSTEILATITQWALDLVDRALALKDDFIENVTELWELGVELVTDKTAETLDTISTWVTDLVDEAVDLKDGFVEEIQELWREIITEVTTKVVEVLGYFTQLVSDIESAFTDKDWGQLGRDIISGIAQAITDGISTITGAVAGLADQALEAAKQRLGIQSPSKEFYSVGQDMARGVELGWDQNQIVDNVSSTFALAGSAASQFGDGFVSTVDWIGTEINQGAEDIGAWGDGFVSTVDWIGTEIGNNTDEFREWGDELGRIIGDLGDEFSEFRKRGEDTFLSLQTYFDSLEFEGIHDAFNIFSGLGNAAASIVNDQISDMESELSTIDEEIAASLEGLDATELQLQFYRENRELFTESTSTDPRVQAIQRLLELEEERARIANEVAEQEAKVLELKEKQQQMQFLQQQFELLQFIEDQGLDAGEILGGLQLGVNADAVAVVDAMSQAMEQAIIAAEETLGISSPSRVFEMIGQETIAGFTQGVFSGVNEMFSSLQMMTQDMIGAMTPPEPVLIETGSSQETNFNVNNSFAGTPQITDASELELLFAGRR